MKFSVGDKVVYPSHGVGVIERIDVKQIGPIEQEFYVLRICDNGMVIMVPTVNAGKVGMRGIINKRDIPKVFKILRGQASEVTENWNRRQKKYQDRIQTGSLFEIAKVYRDLSLLKTAKELSFGERKVLDNARQFIASEIAEAKGIDYSAAESILEEIFA